jgi:hypothetical protein
MILTKIEKRPFYLEVWLYPGVKEEQDPQPQKVWSQVGKNVK